MKDTIHTNETTNQNHIQGAEEEGKITERKLSWSITKLQKSNHREIKQIL